jgi:hypothetical protein
MLYKIPCSDAYRLKFPDTEQNTLAMGTFGGISKLIGNEEACAELDQFIEDNIDKLCLYDGHVLRAVTDEQMRRMAMMGSALVEAHNLPKPKPEPAAA